LALAAVVLEQDAAYWEVHVEQQQQSEDKIVKCNAMFGVASKKDRQFYTALEDQADSEGIYIFLPITASSILNTGM
jgi:hypothetical protein